MESLKELLQIMQPDEWTVIPMTERIILPSGTPWTRKITGRRQRLRELMDLGYCHIRTVTRSPWFSQSSDPHPQNNREHVVIEALLTSQGEDVRKLT